MRHFIDYDVAREHLRAIDPNTDRHIFLATHDIDRRRRSMTMVGTLEELRPRFEALQAKNFAIHVTMNRMTGDRRRNDEVAGVRAVWCERDEPGPSLPVPPSLRIRTRRGRGHDIVLVDEQDPLAPAEAATMLADIARRYRGDDNAKDLARVLRLAGSLNFKDGKVHRVEMIANTGRRYTRAELLAAFPPDPPRPHQVHRPIVLPTDARPMRNQALDDLAAAAHEVATMTDGRRCGLFRCAAKVAKYVANGVLTRSEVTSAFEQAWQVCGGEHDHGRAYAVGSHRDPGAIGRALDKGRNDPLPLLARRYRAGGIYA